MACSVARREPRGMLRDRNMPKCRALKGMHRLDARALRTGNMAPWDVTAVWVEAYGQERPRGLRRRCRSSTCGARRGGYCAQGSSRGVHEKDRPLGGAGGLLRIAPATTYFPTWCGSIIGAQGLTAVFGMGTGVAPVLWSPESSCGLGERRGTLASKGNEVSRSSRLAD